ncbi:hypothetical protein ES708_14853 [subsurface metagenome]
MAKAYKITDELKVELKGTIDYYKYYGKFWILKKYPKKIKPPYTALQAEAQAVFTIASKCLRRISEHILEDWRVGSVGKKASWPDTFRGIIMGYWKLYRVIAPIAIDYKIIETDTQFKVEWDILQVYIGNELPEEFYKKEIILIDKKEILKVHKPVYFTLYLNSILRIVAPDILFGIK